MKNKTLIFNRNGAKPMNTFNLINDSKRKLHFV